jgi:mono/diheme cytochrome c family protein
VKKVRSLVAAIAAAVGVLALSGAASTAEAADKERGRVLYENHCVVCHTPKVHSRPNRIPLSINELRQIVVNWAKEENLRWTDDEVNDVVWYLNTTRYRYTQ